MHKLLVFLVIPILLMGTNSCKKEGCTDFNASNYDSEADIDDGSCFYNGKYVFWTDDDYGVGTIDIYVDDVFQGTIEKFLSSGLPDCGDEGFVTYEAAPGTYDFTAESQNGTQWEGVITVEEFECKTMMLYVSDSKSLSNELIYVGDKPKTSTNSLPLVKK